MRIGIDIDDTIVNTDDAIAEVIDEKNLPIKFKKCQGLPEGFWDAYSEAVHTRAKLKPGVKEAFDWMKENKLEIIIITARGYRDNCDIEKITKDLFVKNNLPYDKIILDSYPKGPDAAREKIDLFFDDIDYNLESLEKHGIDCIKVTEEIDNNSKFRQFTNWHDILAYLKILIQNK